MPRPVYFIVCRDVGLHPDSGLAVVSEILEQIRVSGENPKLSLSLVSSWMREPGELDGKPFDWQCSVIAPSGTEWPLPLQSFEFEAGDSMKRLTMMLGDLPPLTEAGVYWFACRVRRQGTINWTEQLYPVIVEQSPSGGFAPSAD